MERLRRVRCTGPGITRRRRGRGFSYVDPRGLPVDDAEEVKRIKGLAIPPAWTDVWICPHPMGHLQAAGTDDAGRRQYLYHRRWRERRDVLKFERMQGFARALPRLRERCSQQMADPSSERHRVLACAVRLLDRALFRIGSEGYAAANGSFGLATLRKAHVRVAGNEIIFDYPAKGGKRQIRSVADPDLVPIVRDLKARRGGGKELLAYRQDGTWRDLKSSDINGYIKDISGEDYTAKDFRTWHATVLAAVSLAGAQESATTATSRKRVIAGAVRDVSEFLGNTPAVCRASYIDPRVLDRFAEGVTIRTALQGVPADRLDDPIVRSKVEEAVLDLLEGRLERMTPVAPVAPTASAEEIAA